MSWGLSLLEDEGCLFSGRKPCDGARGGSCLLAEGLLRRNISVSLFRSLLTKSHTSPTPNEGA